jgi:hypothetical protein
MGRSFTFQWAKAEFNEIRDLARDMELDHYPFEFCVSSRFQSIGISKSDSIYIVSCFDKKLYLLGKFDIYEVRFGDRQAGVKDQVFVDPENRGLMYFDIVVPSEIIRNIKFIDGSRPKLVSDFPEAVPDPQTFRPPRQITQASANAFDNLLASK